MADATTMIRSHPLGDRHAAARGIDAVPAAPAFRVSLRCGPDSIGAVSEALGVDLPDQPKQSACGGTRLALWLGPDEWLIIDDRADPAAELARCDAQLSAVDVSHRNTAIEVSGTRAADIIAHGCPQDLGLEEFAVGACSRTVFGKVEIVLYRAAEDRFRIEVWRSFCDYVFAYLAEAARDYR